MICTKRGARKQSRTPRSESNVIIHWKSRLCLHKIDRGFTFFNNLVDKLVL